MILFWNLEILFAVRNENDWSFFSESHRNHLDSEYSSLPLKLAPFAALAFAFSFTFAWKGSKFKLSLINSDFREIFNY